MAAKQGHQPERPERAVALSRPPPMHPETQKNRVRPPHCPLHNTIPEARYDTGNSLSVLGLLYQQVCLSDGGVFLCFAGFPGLAWGAIPRAPVR